MTNEELDLINRMQARIEQLERRTLRSRLSRLGAVARRRRGLVAAIATVLVAAVATLCVYAATINDVPNEFTAGTPISAAAMNANFDTLVANDQALNTQLGGIVSSQWTTTGSDISYPSGKVGVGTTSPTNTLHVAHTGGAPVRIQDTQSGVSAVPNIQFGQTETGSWNATGSVGDSFSTVRQMTMSSYSGFPIAFYENGKNPGNGDTPGMYIGTNGYVGIGTTSPVYQLDVMNGAAEQFRLSYNANLGTHFGTRSDGNFQLYAYDIGTASYKNILLGVDGSSTGGYVGIGTVSPASLLSIYKPTGHDVGGLRIQSDSPYYTILRMVTGATSMFAVEAGVNATDDGDGIHTYLNGPPAGNIYIKAYTQGVYLANGGTSWTANSDVRLKTDIDTIDNALELVRSISGVRYHWKDPESQSAARMQVGVIAQEVAEVMPEIINTEDDGYLGVMYDRIVPYLIEAIKELSARNDALAARVVELEARE